MPPDQKSFQTALAERNDRTVWALHRRSLERGLRPTVPAGVLGQAWRGGPQAELSRLLKGCQFEDLDERRATSDERRGRAEGEACARSNTSDVIDAAVTVGAIARGDVVVTSDVNDLTSIADALGVRLDIIAI